MSMTAGSVIAKFKADLTDFKKGLSEARGGISGLSSSLSKAEQGSKVFTGAVAVGVTALTGLVTASTLVAARTETLGIAMEQVAKSTGTSIEMIKEQEAIMKKQGITTQEADTILTKFMQSELDVAQAADIARVAQDLAVIAGKNSSETAGQLTDAIAMQRPMLLRQFGIVQDLNDIFETYAEKMGKSTSALTEQEKKQAMINAIMEAGEKVAGSYEAAMETAGKKMSSLKRHMEEASNAIGGVFLPVFADLIDAVTEFLKQITTENVEKFFDWFVTYGPIVAGVIIGGMIPAIMAMIPAILALAASFIALLPYLIVGGLIGAGVVAIIQIVKNWGSIMDWLGDKFEIVKTAVVSFYNESIKPIFEAIGAVFTWLWEEIIKPYFDFWVEKFTWVYELFMTVWNEFLKPLLEIIGMLFALIFLKIWHAIRDEMNRIWEKITTIWNAIWAFLKPILDTIANFIKEKWEWIKKVTHNAWVWIKSAILVPIIEAYNKVKAKVQEIYDGVKTKFEETLNMVKGLWESIKNAIIGPIKGAWDSVKGIIDKIHNGLKDALNMEKRNSPSVIDIVKRGVGLVNHELMNMGGAISPISHSMVGVGKGGDIINISLSGANISSPEIAEEYAELIGDSIIGKLSKTIRN